MNKEELLTLNQKINDLEQSYLNLQQEKENLIKYLENRIKEENNFDFTESVIFKNNQCIKIETLKEILENVRNFI